MTRYNRHISLLEIGQEGQKKLLQSKVLIIGAGGLGCPILQYLAAAGIGTLGIVDNDCVNESNLQRQVLFGTATLGDNKALAAKERLTDLNPTITIHAYPFRLNHSNAIELFNKYDIIVDGTDNFSSRYLINDAAILCNKPLVYGGIYKFEGQVSVFNYLQGPSYRCLFSKPPQEGSVPNCSEIGVLGVLPGIIGTMQANEVLKIILELGNVLTGKVLYYNALQAQSTLITLKRSEKEFEKVLQSRSYFNAIKVEEHCKIDVPTISIINALGQKNTQFIDVREYHEVPKMKKLSYLQIPLSELEQHIDKIDTNKNTFVFCQSGKRSAAAVSKLQEYKITNCFSIEEGANKILDIVSYDK